MSDQGWSLSDEPIHRHTKEGDVAVEVPGLPYLVQLAEKVPPYMYPRPMSEWGFKRLIPTSSNINPAPTGFHAPRAFVDGESQCLLPAFLYSRPDISCARCEDEGVPCLVVDAVPTVHGVPRPYLLSCYHCRMTVPDPGCSIRFLDPTSNPPERVAMCVQLQGGRMNQTRYRIFDPIPIEEAKGYVPGLHGDTGPSSNTVADPSSPRASKKPALSVDNTEEVDHSEIGDEVEASSAGAKRPIKRLRLTLTDGKASSPHVHTERVGGAKRKMPATDTSKHFDQMKSTITALIDRAHDLCLAEATSHQRAKEEFSSALRQQSETIEEKQRLIEHQRRAIDAQHEALAGKDAKLAASQEEIDKLKQALAEKDRVIHEGHAVENERQREIARIKECLQKQQKELEAEQSLMEEKEAELASCQQEKDDLEAELEKFKQSHIKLEDAVQALKAEKNGLKADAAATRARLRDIESTPATNTLEVELVDDKVSEEGQVEAKVAPTMSNPADLARIRQQDDFIQNLQSHIRRLETQLQQAQRDRPQFDRSDRGWEDYNRHRLRDNRYPHVGPSHRPRPPDERPTRQFDRLPASPSPVAAAPPSPSVPSDHQKRMASLAKAKEQLPYNEKPIVVAGYREKFRSKRHAEIREGNLDGFALPEGWDAELFRELGWKTDISMITKWSNKRWVVVGGRCRRCVEEQRPCIRIIDSNQVDCLTCSQARQECSTQMAL